jgi:hypothetical protein
LKVIATGAVPLAAEASDTARGGGDCRNDVAVSTPEAGGGGGPGMASGKLRQLVQRQFNPQCVSF